MSGDNKDVKLSLTVMLNKQRNKLLYAVADNHFADILLSFLTLPLGRIVKILEKHYGEKAPTIGSLNSLYHSLANLDTAHFVTEGAKKSLLNIASSFEAEYEKLKVDFTDSPPAEFFVCSKCGKDRFRSVSMYYDKVSTCYYCKGVMSKEVVEKSSEAAASSDGVFTTHTSSFLISNDLHVLPKEAGFLQIISFLGITNTDYKSEPMKVDFGFSEVMDLLKASLMSPTPLSDIILNKTTQMKMNTPVVGSQPTEVNPKNGNFILKVIIQKSTGKLLYAQTKEDFVEFLFSLLFIPLGIVEHLLAGKICFKAIYNLHRSADEFIDDDYFKSPDTKKRLLIPNLVHGCISKNHILPLIEKYLPSYYNNLSWFSSDNFPKGKGLYLQQPRTYQLKDDLTVEPYCFVSILSNLEEQKIMISDVEEVELKIGLKEALCILKASLSSTSALSDALLNHTSLKQPKREP